MVLIHKDAVVYFVVEKYHAVRISDMGGYCLKLMQKSYCCVDQNTLLDYYPLPENTAHGTRVIILHHSFPLFQINGIIGKALPHITEETQWKIITKLESSGLESKEDLKCVQQEDIRDLLPVIQCRKLLNAFKLGKDQV